MKKKILAIHLNEFNLGFLSRGALKYNKKNITKLLRLKKIKTFTKDKIQNKNLDPWVQSVSINTGISSKKHRIFNLGQNLTKDYKSIWDYLTKKKIICGVWGSMNSKYKPNQNLKLYFPDPWNYKDKVHPKLLRNLFYLPKYYAKNYLDYSVVKLTIFIFKFLLGIIQNKSLIFLTKNIFFFMKFFLKRGIKNYILFFIFDIISLNIFKQHNKKTDFGFSLIFLNSLAHFQHNNWDEKILEKDFFEFTDLICQLIFEISKNYSSLIIYNGFTQKKIPKEYLIRPVHPIKFLNFLKIDFIKVEQDMTNGALVFFRNNQKMNKSYYIFNNYRIFGFKLFEVRKINNKCLYYKINIKSFTNKLIFEEINKTKFNKIFSFYKFPITKEKFDKKYTKEEFYNLFNKLSFIKSTGVHKSEGIIFYKNFSKLKKVKVLENRKIFHLLKNEY